MRPPDPRNFESDWDYYDALERYEKFLDSKATRDRTGGRCPRCWNGVLLERSLQDDIDGMFTCDSCYSRTRRYN